MEEFLNIAIVGTSLSLLMEYLKTAMGTTPLGTKAMTIASSVVLGTVYVLFAETHLWGTIMGILASASTVYALFLKKS